MALRAILAELAAMNVFLRMAAEATHGQTRVRHVLLCVARIAGGLGMLAGQRETRLLAVIEADARPAIGAMAGLASRCETALMHIVPLVTAGTGQFGILEGG